MLCQGCEQYLELETPDRPKPWARPLGGARAGPGAGQTPGCLCRWGTPREEADSWGRVCPRGDLTSGGCLGMLHESHPPPRPLTKGRRVLASSAACNSPSSLLQHATHADRVRVRGLSSVPGLGWVPVPGAAGHSWSQTAWHQPAAHPGDRAGWGCSGFHHRLQQEGSPLSLHRPPPRWLGSKGRHRRKMLC